RLAGLAPAALDVGGLRQGDLGAGAEQRIDHLLDQRRAADPGARIRDQIEAAALGAHGSDTKANGPRETDPTYGGTRPPRQCAVRRRLTGTLAGAARMPIIAPGGG